MLDTLLKLEPGTSSVLVVHAHPDDEIFATGATIAELAARGIRVVLLTASAGEASERDAVSMTLARQCRSARLARSCAVLGAAEWGWLSSEGRWIDTAGKPGPGALTSASIDELAVAVSQAIAKIGPKVVLTVGDDGLTGHPDHVLIHHAVIRAVSQQVAPAPLVFGAHLKRMHVVAAQRLFSQTIAEPVGSGWVKGCVDETQLLEMHGSLSAGRARRDALDAYVDGLGTADLADLLQRYQGRGDSLLLRGVLDISGWHVDYYRDYSR